jgi:hypothetical protein
MEMERMKFLLQSTLLAGLLAFLPSASAQARTYDAFRADVPFKFNIGNRTFRAGHYQFVVVGAGLMALRDAKERTIASLITRPVETDAPLSSSKLVFKTQKKRYRLSQIVMENRSQVLEILGEQIAMRPAPQPSVWSMPPDNSLFERHDAPGFKH